MASFAVGIKESAACYLREKAYGDASVGYVQLKRKNNVCVVKCQICPEHGVRSQNYSIILEVDKSEENKVKAECQDCAAPTGGCKHAIAFVMWVHRRSEEPSPTEHFKAQLPKLDVVWGMIYDIGCQRGPSGPPGIHRRPHGGPRRRENKTEVHK
ncbi:hypothetical protein HUJ05_003285 [Dendroctonus ponderosae]|nr:hypothetical protein HUJ05_003285 [Dendroctonus ponderosae]